MLIVFLLGRWLRLRSTKFNDRCRARTNHAPIQKHDYSAKILYRMTIIGDVKPFQNGHRIEILFWMSRCASFLPAPPPPGLPRPTVPNRLACNAVDTINLTTFGWMRCYTGHWPMVPPSTGSSQAICPPWTMMLSNLEQYPLTVRRKWHTRSRCDVRFMCVTVNASASPNKKADHFVNEKPAKCEVTREHHRNYQRPCEIPEGNFLKSNLQHSVCDR